MQDLGLLTLAQIKKLDDYKNISEKYYKSRQKRKELVEIIIKLYPEKYCVSQDRIKHAMTSKEASEKKIRGHKVEEDVAKCFGGDVARGRDKVDVIIHNKKCSVKKISKRLQLTLLSIHSKCMVKNKICRLLQECQYSFPENRTDYTKNKVKYKKLLQKPMTKLKDYLQDKENLKNYLKFVFTNLEDGFLLIIEYSDHSYYIFDMDEVIDKLTENIIVINSRARSYCDMDSQKVIFKIKIGDKLINLVDNEIRNSGKNHYREFLAVCNSEKLIYFLLNNLPKNRSIKHGILFGKAELC